MTVPLLMDPTRLEAHPDAALVPSMRLDEYSALLADIRERGVKVPLEVLGLVVLDGLHRLRAARELGLAAVPVVEVSLNSETPLDYMMKAAVLRRHLTDDQRRVMAARWARKNPKPRGGDRKSQDAKSNASHPHALDRVAGASPAQVEAAARFKVSPTSVRRAAEVDRARPDLAEQVFVGAVTLAEARGEMTKASLREDAKRVAREINAKTGDDFGISVGDFREIGSQLEDESVALIFTDPPYARTSLSLYGDLAQLAARVLKPGGSLITYASIFQLPETLDLIRPHLRYWSTIACIHTGASARLMHYGMLLTWKPMLWFVKGNRRLTSDLVAASVMGQREKVFHEWEQSLAEASYYIEHLTRPGDLVADPFCGGGTSILAARLLGRRTWGAEIKEDVALIARGRIAQALASMDGNSDPRADSSDEEPRTSHGDRTDPDGTGSSAIEPDASVIKDPGVEAGSPQRKEVIDARFQ